MSPTPVPFHRRAVRRTRRAAREQWRRLLGVEALSFSRLPPAIAFRMAYNVVLRREPDDTARRDYLPPLERGELSRTDLVDWLRGSDEFVARTPMGARSLGPSLHASRCDFIRSLPPARRILDLGGTHTANQWGAFVLMGYPYDFESLTIVDLPPDERHPLYRTDSFEAVATPRGPVSYSYHSMTDLSVFADATFDLVYSGQSIEHVTPDDAKRVAAEVLRVLRPGGTFALDTPNAVVTRLQSDEFIDPDHEIEYTAPELRELLVDAGFTIDREHGLNLAERSVRDGRFDEAEVAANRGLFAHAEACYLLAVVARKPAPG
ncbi:MAG TPA: methyltransferase domain-containing protein [Acidimicrobiales bacterium]|nr:methyltransferase domain-containing protein [Acidimicrobiales bacterium]